MARVDYDTWATRGQSKKDSDFQKVGYFKLDNDGAEALVRFTYGEPSEFDIADIHRVKVTDSNGKSWYRNISCLRTPDEPIEKCPLCVKKEPLKTRFFVKLIEYTKDENGKVVVTPKVWERPSGFIKEMKNLINTYGDLKECVFKIVRNGAKFNAKGEPNTDVTYTIMYQPPHIYKEELGYVKDFSAFENFDISKHSYTVRSAEDVQVFLETGDFPVHNKVAKEAATAEAKPVMAAPAPVATQVAPAVESVPAATPAVTVDNDGVVTKEEPAPAPASTEPQTFDPTNGRPRRTYVWKEQ